MPWTHILGERKVRSPLTTRLSCREVRRASECSEAGIFERARGGRSVKPLEGIMPKHFKNMAVRTCALACAFGLSLNTFAIASGAAGKVVAKNSRQSSVLPSADPEPSPTPMQVASSPMKDSMATRSGEGRQYGQPGLVGEPINLNVVNADVRDILNYVTEQYGINFVIDSSVGAVPVTVNVQEVPWNYALDAILRANRLGIDVNGNILRVATSESLAKEAETQRIMKDAQLSSAPLVTEFIRLNYARASGTLAQAAGSSAAYAGGLKELRFSGGAGRGSDRVWGASGFLPVRLPSLSPLGFGADTIG